MSSTYIEQEVLVIRKEEKLWNGGMYGKQRNK